MKPTMLSKKNASYLFDHVLDGFRSSYEGIEKLKDSHLIDEKEFTELLEKNSDRLIQRIREFKILTGLISVFFSILFLYMQVMGDNLDMRRPARARTSSSRTSGRTGRTGRGSRRKDNNEPEVLAI